MQFFFISVLCLEGLVRIRFTFHKIETLQRSALWLVCSNEPANQKAKRGNIFISLNLKQTHPKPLGSQVSEGILFGGNVLINKFIVTSSNNNSSHLQRETEGLTTNCHKVQEIVKGFSSKNNSGIIWRYFMSRVELDAE